MRHLESRVHELEARMKNNEAFLVTGLTATAMALATGVQEAVAAEFNERESA
jgi:hypothetical protein